MRPLLISSFVLYSALLGTSAGLFEAVCATETKGCEKEKIKSGHQFTGMADYYHHSLYGRRTSSGQVLEKHLYTAAHRTLPFGTHVHVKNHTNGRSVVVVINDRGPFTKSKVIDLSHQAAVDLGMISAGTCRVGCTVVPKPLIAGKPDSMSTQKIAVKIASEKVAAIATTSTVSAKVPEVVALKEPLRDSQKESLKPVHEPLNESVKESLKDFSREHVKVATLPKAISSVKATLASQPSAQTSSEPTTAGQDAAAQMLQLVLNPRMDEESGEPLTTTASPAMNSDAKNSDIRADENSAELPGAEPINWSAR